MDICGSTRKLALVSGARERHTGTRKCVLEGFHPQAGTVSLEASAESSGAGGKCIVGHRFPNTQDRLSHTVISTDAKVLSL